MYHFFRFFDSESGLVWWEIPGDFCISSGVCDGWESVLGIIGVGYGRRNRI